jgi:integrase
MGRKPNPVPTYSLHRKSNTARCWVGGKWVQLGPWDSPESKAEYARICERVRTGKPATPSPKCPTTEPSVVEVVAAFRAHAEAHYRDADGLPTKEIDGFRLSLGPLLELYADLPAAEFGPLSLKAVRQRMIDGGLARGTINQRVGRITRVFKWAASEELVPAAVFHALATVAGLKKGRSAARETDPVTPVPDEDVERTLGVMNATHVAMLRVIRLAGMRPGEACRLTPGKIDRTQEPWVYRPRKHKTTHRGKARVIHFGPRAREILSAVIRWDEPDAPVFRPAEAKAERYAAIRKPGTRAGRKAKPPGQLVKRPGTWFNAASLAHSVADACERAGVAHWHPGQLRHSVATEVRKKYGFEAAGAGLGHDQMSATAVYAERNEELAAKVAAEIG